MEENSSGYVSYGDILFADNCPSLCTQRLDQENVFVRVDLVFEGDDEETDPTEVVEWGAFGFLFTLWRRFHFTMQDLMEYLNLISNPGMNLQLPTFSNVLRLAKAFVLAY